MAGEAQLPAEERAKVQAQLNEIRAKLGNVSWARVAKALNAHARNEKEETSGETLRKMGDLGIGGAKVQRLVARHLGLDVPEVVRTVERPERYPTVALEFSRARAAGVSDAVLDTVRLQIGVYKSDSGPSPAEIQKLIKDEITATKRMRKLYDAKDIDANIGRGRTR